jgi:hypothetical protein
MRPKLYHPATILVICALFCSCRKHSDSNTAALLQHKWQIISINGEALRYVGEPADYFDFENGQLIEYFGGKYDTMTYKLINNDQAIELHIVVNNIVIGETLDLHINALTSNQLILDGSASPAIHILDSLRR